MERDRLARLMEHPAPPSKEDLVGLRTMTERYPWFSGAHLLLAIGDHAAGDVLFDEQLRTTAAHLPSRAVLHDLLDRPADVDTSTAPTDIRPVEGSSVESLSKDPAPAPALHGAPGPVIVPATEDVPAAVAKHEPAMPAPPGVEAVEPLPPSRQEALPDTSAAHAPTPLPIDDGTDEVGADPDPLDELIRGTALANTYGLLLSESAPLPPKEVPEPMVAPPVEVAPPSAPSPPSAALPGRLRFTAWLEMGTSPGPAVPALEVRAPAVPSSMDVQAAPATVPGTPVAPAGVPDLEATKALIDRFIGLSAPAPVKKAEFFTPQQAAKRSLEDHVDLVSETLARIHEQQGNIAKAVAAYRKLAARHPERAAHFNALAEALTRR